MYILMSRDHNYTVAFQGGTQRKWVWRHNEMYNWPTSRPSSHLQRHLSSLSGRAKAEWVALEPNDMIGSIDIFH